MAAFGVRLVETLTKFSEWRGQQPGQRSSKLPTVTYEYAGARV